MEEQNPVPVSQPEACILCNSPDYDRSYQTHLCSDCRKKHSWFPFPVWIKGMALVIVLLFIIGVYLIPKSFERALHIERAKKAEEEKHFLLAAREYEVVCAEHPSSVDFKTHLFHAYFMNNDFGKAGPLIQFFGGKHTDDNEYANIINADLGQLSYLFDDTIAPKIAAANKADTTALQMLIYYSTEHPEVQLTYFLIADKLYDLKKFHEADSVTAKLLAINPDFPPLKPLVAATKRELGKYDEALAIYNEMLEQNQDDIGAITGRARLEIKMFHDKEAENDIALAESIDPKNILVFEPKIILLFLEGKKMKLENFWKQ